MADSIYRYVSPQEIAAAFGEKISQILNAGSSVDIGTNAVLRSAIESVNAEIDAYLRPRYALPLRCVDASLKRVARSMAKYFIITDTRPEILTEADRLAFEDAKDFLGKVSSGKTLMDFPPEDQTELLQPAVSVQVGSTNATGIQTASGEGWFNNF
jgi:phage gp36-like protein